MSLFLFAADPKVFRFVPLTEQDLLPAICVMLATSVVLALAGIFVSGNAPHRNHTGIPVLLLYILFGPFGIVLWLIDREARDRAREKAATNVRRRKSQ